ncbi:MAG: FliM/FliN family flagellar motor switch protein [Bradymonadaceae bacterium]
MDQFPTQRLPAVQSPRPKPAVSPFPYHHLERLPASRVRFVNGMLAALPPQGDEAILEELAGWLSEHLAGETGAERWRLEMHLLAATAGRVSVSEFDHGFSTMVSIAPGRERALLSVDSTLVESWLSRLLMCSLRRKEPARPGHFEGGLITGILLGVCRELATRGYSPLVLSSAQTHRPRLEDWLTSMQGSLVEATFLMTSSTGVRGLVRVFMGEGFLRRLIDDASRSTSQRDAIDLYQRPPWAQIPIAPRILLGEVTLPALEAFRLRPGDLLLPDDHGLRMEALGAAEGCGRLYLGSHDYLRCLLRPEEGLWQLELVEDRPSRRADSTHHGEGESMAEHGMDGSDEETMSMAAAADLRIDVQLGRFHTTVGELTRMRRGTVVELKTPVGRPVDLVVAGQPIGQGELVIIEGHLGVRILSMGRGKP